MGNTCCTLYVAPCQPPVGESYFMIVSVFSSSQAAALPTEGVQNWGSKQYLLYYLS